MLRAFALRKNPLIAVEIDAPHPSDGPISGIRFGEGLIVIDNEAALLHRRRMFCMVLASAGLRNMQIARFACNSENTIKTHISQALSLLPITSRMGFAPYSRDVGVYKVVRKAEPLGLSPTDSAILDQLSMGKNHQTIANDLDVSIDKVNRGLADMKERTGLTENEELILGGLMSGEACHRAITPPTFEDSQYLSVGELSPGGSVAFSNGFSLAHFVDGGHQQSRSSPVEG